MSTATLPNPCPFSPPLWFGAKKDYYRLLQRHVTNIVISSILFFSEIIAYTNTNNLIKYLYILFERTLPYFKWVIYYRTFLILLNSHSYFSVYSQAALICSPCFSHPHLCLTWTIMRRSICINLIGNVRLISPRHWSWLIKLKTIWFLAPSYNLV